MIDIRISVLAHGRLQFLILTLMLHALGCLSVLRAATPEGAPFDVVVQCICVGQTTVDLQTSAHPTGESFTVSTTDLRDRLKHLGAGDHLTVITAKDENGRIA